MKNIDSFKLFTDKLNEEYSNERFPKKEFDEFTKPEKPFKRKLTVEETDFMHKYFKNYSWSDIDNLGRIILGGGIVEDGKYYITEDDLKQFMNEVK